MWFVVFAVPQMNKQTPECQVKKLITSQKFAFGCDNQATTF
jgi:hypothetical protein